MSLVRTRASSCSWRKPVSLVRSIWDHQFDSRFVHDAHHVLDLLRIHRTCKTKRGRGHHQQKNQLQARALDRHTDSVRRALRPKLSSRAHPHRERWVQQRGVCCLQALWLGVIVCDSLSGRGSYWRSYRKLKHRRRTRRKGGKCRKEPPGGKSLNPDGAPSRQQTETENCQSDEENQADAGMGNQREQNGGDEEYHHPPPTVRHRSHHADYIPNYRCAAGVAGGGCPTGGAWRTAVQVPALPE